MAENITMKQVPNGTVKAVDDRILYDYALSSGVIYGCEISYIGNNMIHINAGYGIIKGGLFEMEDHVEYVDYAENENTTGQIYLHFDASADDKLTIVKETTPSLHVLVQDDDANYDGGVYEIQLCTFTATTTTLENVKQTFQMSSMPIDVLDTLPEIVANTTPGKAAGALAVKELNNNLSVNSTSFIFDYKNGEYGYNTSPSRGADTFHPFKSLAPDLAIPMNQLVTTGLSILSGRCTYTGGYMIKGGICYFDITYKATQSLVANRTVIRGFPMPITPFGYNNENFLVFYEYHTSKGGTRMYVEDNAFVLTTGRSMSTGDSIRVQGFYYTNVADT